MNLETHIIPTGNQNYTPLVLRTTDGVVNTREHYTPWFDMGDVMVHLYFTDNSKPRNGEYVIADGWVWEFRDETGFGSAPMPYWASHKTCKRIVASTNETLWEKQWGGGKITERFCLHYSLNRPDYVEVETFTHCQAQEEDSERCKERCDHCTEYYRPIDFNNPFFKDGYIQTCNDRKDHRLFKSTK